MTGPFVYCGIGASASDFPSAVKGNIALIERGTATFNTKTKNAVAAGATGVIIYNCSMAASPSTCGNDDFTGGWTLIGKVDSTGQANSAVRIRRARCSAPARTAPPIWPIRGR